MKAEFGLVPVGTYFTWEGEIWQKLVDADIEDGYTPRLGGASDSSGRLRLFGFDLIVDIGIEEEEIPDF